MSNQERGILASLLEMTTIYRGITEKETKLQGGTFVFSTNGNHRLQTLFKVFRQVQKDVH